MRNRFYYSEEQARVQDAMQDSYAYIVLPTGEEIRYTQWCSQPTSKCNFADAQLVYECDDFPNIRVEQNEDYIPFFEEEDFPFYDDYERDLDDEFVFDYLGDEPDDGSFYDPKNNPEEDDDED